MGIWSSVALGLALAQARRRVFLLAGDGDLLMSLQSLATIAQAAPPNLRIVVFHDGAYSSTGGQPLAGGEQLDFAAVARSLGLARAVEVRSPAALGEALDRLCAGNGPALVSVRLDDGPCPAMPPGPWAQVEERTLFMRAVLGSRCAADAADPGELR
jgi:thiamine pyrophosphate-dependent acetolactate synthase large subunit-like protein